jgi:hypothetical protein
MAFVAPLVPLITVGITAVTTGLMVLSSVQQKKAADQAADQAKQAARENARRQSIEARKRIGLMRANYGASGVTIEGSPLDVLEESAANAELDKLTILHGGSVEAGRYRAAGRAAFAQGIGSAASDLLGGGLAAYDQWDEAQTEKLKATG